MARTKISEFSSTPGSNTDIDGINIAEGCAPSGINDAIRELMSQLKDFQAGTAGDSFNGPVGTTTAAAGAFTTLSASSTVSGTGFSNYLASPPAIGGTAAAAGSFTTLTTSSTVTHNGGTANGVAYLNGSKVLTTGSALTFDGTNLTNNAGVFLSTSATGGNGYVGAIGTGMRLVNLHASSNIDIIGNGGINLTTAGNYPFAFSIAGSEQMRLTSTGLGIGTSSPSYKLDVYGSGTPVAAVRSSASGDAKLYLECAGTNSGYVAYNRSLQALTFSGNNSTNHAILDSAGNLGLGVTPSAWGVYKAADINTRGLGLAGGDQSYAITCNAYYDGSTWRYKGTSSYRVTRLDSFDGAYVFYTAPSGTAGDTISFTQAMTLDASGNLGVGTTSPTARIHSNGTIQSVTGSTGIQIYGDGGTGYVNSIGAYPLVFQVNSTERARIDSSGNLLVGTTSATGKLTVAQSGTGTAADISTSNTSTTNVISVYRPNNGNMLSFNNNGSIVGSISVTTTTSYNTTSDQRLKHDIVDAPDASGLIDAIKVRSFKWNTDDSEQRYGFIAQELVTVAPEAVHQPEDPEEMMAVDYSKLVPMLVKEVQSLRARVAQLESN